MQARETRILKDEVTFDKKDMNAQAEISFKMGLEEVVEWIQLNSGLDVDDETLAPNGMRSFDDAEWQAKLKSWGIK